MWTQILGTLTGPIVTYLTRRAELKAQAHQNELDILKAQGERQSALAIQGLTADAAWEQEFARQASSSWKDEYTLLVVSVPALLCFVKTSWLDGPAIVKAGFQSLSETPAFYQL